MSDADMSMTDTDPADVREAERLLRTCVEAYARGDRHPFVTLLATLLRDRRVAREGWARAVAQWAEYMCLYRDELGPGQAPKGWEMEDREELRQMQATLATLAPPAAGTTEE